MSIYTATAEPKGIPPTYFRIDTGKFKGQGFYGTLCPCVYIDAENERLFVEDIAILAKPSSPNIFGETHSFAPSTLISPDDAY